MTGGHRYRMSESLLLKERIIGSERAHHSYRKRRLICSNGRHRVSSHIRGALAEGTQMSGERPDGLSLSRRAAFSVYYSLCGARRHFVKRIQSTSRNAPSFILFGRQLKNPTFAPIHRPSFTWNGSPAFLNVLPSRLYSNCA